MNEHVRPISGNAEPCLVGKPKRAASKKPKSYAELDAEHHAAFSAALHLEERDEELCQKYFGRAWSIEKEAARSAVPLNRADEITLIKMMVRSAGGSFDDLENEFISVGIGAIVLKLLKNTLASDNA